MFADIRDATTVRKAVEGVDVVFHIASFGMSGRYAAHFIAASRRPMLE
jgi:uncharacterized protein YbjT (DUF2867 family)